MEVLKKLLTFIFVFIFLISMTSALDFNADNYKKFNKDDSKYGKIEHWDKGQISPDTKLAEYKLLKNTDQCLINCEAEGTVELFEKSRLFDDLKFKNHQGNLKQINSYKILIKYDIYYDIEIDDYSEICKDVNRNGSIENYCTNEIIGSHTETKHKSEWKEYDNKKLEIGFYEWKIIGKKKANEKIDWIASAFGQEMIEWAWWNTDWLNKKQINISENAGSSINNYTMKNLIIPIEPLMKSDLGDIRFTNGTENTELGFYIWFVNASEFRVSVMIADNLVPLVNNSIFMYYNNPSASSTSNIEDAYIVGNDVSSSSGWTSNSGGGSVVVDTSDRRIEFDIVRDGSTQNAFRTIPGGLTNLSYEFVILYSATTGAISSTAVSNVTITQWTSLGASSNAYGLMGVSDNNFYNRMFEGSDTEQVMSPISLNNVYYGRLLKYGSILNVTLYNDVSRISFNQTGIQVASNTNDLSHYLTAITGFDASNPSAHSIGWITNMTVSKYIFPEPTFTIGEEQLNENVETTLITPIENQNFSNSNITFTFNSTPIGVNLTNVTLLIWHSNGSLFHENFTSLSGNATITTIKNIQGFSSGNFIWNALTKGTDGFQDFDTNRTFTVDINAPIINVTSPTGVIVSNLEGINLTLNWSVSDPNLQSCWFEYNLINTTVICSDNNFSFSTNSQQNLTFYANDSVGNLGSNFTSWEFLFEKYNVTFNNQTSEGSQETFTAEIILGLGETILEAIFYYNNTNYTTNIIFSGGEYLITSSILIPLVSSPTNFSLGFFIVISGQTYNLQTFNQTVFDINISECSPGGNLLLNMSLKDEISKLDIVGDIEINAQAISKSSGETVSSTSTNFLNISSASICLSPLELFENLYLDAEIKYSSNNYASELYHIQKADLSEYPKNLSLFDLANNLSTEFLIKYQDDDLISVEGAVVQLQRKYIGEDLFEVVEAPLTSDIGTAIVHVDLNSNKYQATIVKDGSVLDVFTNLVFNCENPLSGQCTENLFGKIDSQNDIPLVELNDFAYSISSINNTITTLFIIPSGTPASVNILLNQVDQFGNKSACNQTIISSGGSIDCTFEDTIGDSFLELKVLKNSELQAQESFIIIEDSGLDFLGNNFFIVIVFLLSIVGMAFSSPEWMIINAVFTMTISGAFWLLNGLDFVMGLGSLMYLIIGAGILIKELSKQEDR